MCLTLCTLLDWQYAELPSTAIDAVLCTVLVCRTSNQIYIKNIYYRLDKKKQSIFISHQGIHLKFVWVSNIIKILNQTSTLHSE